ncbi:hypothetical protein ACETU7_36080 [Rhodococcus sp. 3Y1]
MPVESIELRYRVGDDVSESEAIRALVATKFATETSALQWPAFVFGAVEHHHADLEADPSFTLFHAVDHAHSDMNSMVLMYAELRQLYAAETTGSHPELGPAGSYAQFGRVERERTTELTMQSPEVHQWLGYLMRSGGSFPGFPLPLGAEDAPKPAIGSRFDLADDIECERSVRFVKPTAPTSSAECSPRSRLRNSNSPDATSTSPSRRSAHEPRPTRLRRAGTST